MGSRPPLRFGVIGIDHRHIYDQVGSLLGIGAECAGFWTHDGDVRTLKGFVVGCDNLGEGAAICVPAQGRATRITHNAIATQAGDTQATGIHPLDTGDKPP